MRKQIKKIHSLHSLKTLSTLTLILIITTGCGSAIQKKSPPISHVHIGHTLKGWVTTPGKTGLLTTAGQEAKITLAQSLKAKQSSTLAMKKKYMSNAIHALDPNIQAKGPGRGYGLTRALTESIAHIQFAASSDDASANIKKTVPGMVTKARQIASASNQLKVFGQAAMGSTSINEFNALNEEYLSTAKQIDGKESSGSYSLVQFNNDIQTMISKEKPAYTTVDSYYLFNLIRLPTGKWAFSSKKPSEDKNDYSY